MNSVVRLFDSKMRIFHLLASIVSAYTTQKETSIGKFRQVSDFNISGVSLPHNRVAGRNNNTCLLTAQYYLKHPLTHASVTNDRH